MTIGEDRMQATIVVCPRSRPTMNGRTPLSRQLAANLITQASGILFPLITFPYISRVLGPEGLGRISFAEAMAGYFLMFSMVGIPLYGVRESAKRRDDKTALSTLVAELFVLNVVMAIVSTGMFCIFMLFSHRAHTDPILFWIYVSPMFMAPIGFNWLLEALEEHVYIALRTLGIRICIVVAVFVFIRTQDDYLVYAILTTANLAAASLLNVLRVRRYISISVTDWREWNVGRHISPVLLVCSIAGAVSIYTSLNKVILGYLTTDGEVGFYSVADRIVKAIVTLAAGIGVVLLPRVSCYVQSERMSEYKHLPTPTLKLIFFISLPAVAGVIVVAKPLVSLLSGCAFEPAAVLVQIMAPTIMLIALGSFISYQILYPQGKEMLLFYSALCGAICSVGLNMALIPRWQAVGAAISVLAAEICVTGTRIVLSQRCSGFEWPIRSMLKYTAASLFMAVVVLCLRSHVAGPIARLVVSVSVGPICYTLTLCCLKDSLLSVIWGRLAACATRQDRTPDSGL